MLAFVLLAIFGLVAESWATALVIAIVFALAGSLSANAFHISWLPAAILFFGLGLFVGMVNRKRMPVWIPPIFSAAFIAWGCAICWAPHWRGAKLWQLNDLDWVLGFAAICAVVLLALSLEREHRKKLRFAARTKSMDDDDLKKELASRRAGFARFNNIDPPKRSRD